MNKFNNNIFTHTTILYSTAFCNINHTPHSPKSMLASTLHWMNTVYAHTNIAWWGRDCKAWNKNFRTRSYFTKIAPGPFLCAQIYLRTRSISPPSRCEFALLLLLFQDLGGGEACLNIYIKSSMSFWTCVSWQCILTNYPRFSMTTRTLS